jgi:hypothetical protein
MAAYLHCPSCERTAWLDSTSEPALLCLHCETALTPMPGGYARRLIAAVRRRFERDAELDAGRPRFVRD